MARRRILASLTIVLGTILAAYLALPMIGELLTPGPVAEVHAETEKNCLSCHVPFLKSGQDGRCKGCHEEVARDIERRIGFHGRNPQSQAQACATCHDEHKGRAHPIVTLDREAFDHGFTDFALTGAHRAVQCASCHEPGDKFRSAPLTCVACHRQDDRHDGRFGTSCQGCHETSAWNRVRDFDHSVTGFNLVGKHQGVTCEACHTRGRFVGTPTTCVACHAQDDVHQGARGNKCEACHVASGWNFVDFDHQRDTRFPLTGSHRAATCVACHGPGERVARPPTTCVGCHADNDVHEGAYGRDCADCHKTTRWPDVNFDHARSGFPLRGAHAALACKTCHVKPAGVQRLPLTCNGCHIRDDPHRGALGTTCATCHGDRSWKPAAGFDHARTGFALTGRHRAVTCTACHADKRFAAKGVTCSACHADTRHRGRFGRAPDCASCHTTAQWGTWTFDHARDTGFPLLGRHARLSCYDCHSGPPQGAAAGATCAECHRADDIHRGEFGSDCAQCHTTTDWKDATVRKVSRGARPGVRKELPP